MELDLPNGWRPRVYQRPLWRHLENGGRRAAAVWHRRSGKDNVALNWAAVAAHRRIGTYWHMLPTAIQGHMVVWEGRDSNTGKRFIDQAFPEAIRANTRNDRMQLELRCGSLFQVVGSDNYDRLVGANPVGVVFSEWSLTDPRAWDYVRPILAENGGWAVFLYTPRGKNHGYELYDMARGNDDWFTEILTVDDTRAISPAVIDEERRAGMSEALISQEYYCSFDAGGEGTYYGRLMEDAEKAKRIGRVPVQTDLAVDTWWDLGMDDDMAIWFVQKVGQELHVVDYYECNGEGLAHYAKMLQDRGYVYGTHWAPHDIAVRELGTGKSRLEVARGLGIKFQVAPKLPVEDGIEAVRNVLPRCWFDLEKCRHGIRALKQYHREYNEKRGAYLPHPVHNWASHGADAFRTGAINVKAARAPDADRRRRRGSTRGRTWASA